MRMEKDKDSNSYRSLKYLITGIDDMRDVISTIWSMINTNIERDERVNIARMIVPASQPLKQSSSSFILSLKVPRSIMGNNDAGKQRK